jgi:hypothetical protein
MSAHLSQQFHAMTNDQIMEALRFLHTAMNYMWKRDKMYPVYEKQLRELLRVQLNRAGALQCDQQD